MAASNRATPGMIMIGVIVALLIIGGLWWKFMGSSSTSRTVEAGPPAGPAQTGVQRAPGEAGPPGR